MPASTEPLEGALPRPRRRLTATAADGVRIAIQEWGEPTGPELLFIHGAMQSHLCWCRQLTGALARFRIVTIDLRGHGDSDKPSDIATYSQSRQWADDLALVIETAGLRRPTVAAWSFGGIVVTNYLLAYGEARLAGINFTGAVTEFGAALAGRDTQKSVAALLDEDYGIRIDAVRAFVRVCFEKQPNETDFERMLVYNAQTTPLFMAGVAAMKMEGVEALLRKLSLPVLVTQGDADRLVPVSAARAIAERVPGARLSMYPGIGHSPFYEEPERFNRELASFAEQNQRRA